MISTSFTILTTFYDIYFLDGNYVFLIYTCPFIAKTLQLIDFHVRFNFNSIKWYSETSFRYTSSPLSIYKLEKHMHWQTIETVSSFDVSYSILNHQIRRQWNLHITNHIWTDIHWLNHANVNVLAPKNGEVSLMGVVTGTALFGLTSVIETCDSSFLCSYIHV